MGALLKNQALQSAQRYTYSDYITWGDEVDRCELIDGEIFFVDTPTTQHQAVSMEFVRVFGNFFKGRKCRVFHAPFDVRLNPSGADNTVVQPDIVVVCDPSKLDRRCCVGAPDLVVEILSPSTSKMDLQTKFTKYETHGVKEYWIVDPGNQTIQLYALENGAFVRKQIFDNTDETAESLLFEGLSIKTADVFAGLDGTA